VGAERHAVFIPRNRVLVSVSELRHLEACLLTGGRGSGAPYRGRRKGVLSRRNRCGTLLGGLRFGNGEYEGFRASIPRFTEVISTMGGFGRFAGGTFGRGLLPMFDSDYMPEGK
jgi:hypothetical protein